MDTEKPSDDEAALAVRREREAIQCWLHDTVLQTLEYIASGGYSDAPMDMEEVSLIAGRAADDLRDTLSSWEHDQEIDLVPELHRVVDEANRRKGCRFELEVGPFEEGVSGSPAASLAGAVREALNNVHKHAHATRASVYCEECDGTATVRVDDDGRGFPQGDEPVGIGIRRSIVGRIVQEGGTALIRSAPDEGTHMELRVPRMSASNQTITN